MRLVESVTNNAKNMECHRLRWPRDHILSKVPRSPRRHVKKADPCTHRLPWSYIVHRRHHAIVSSTNTDCIVPATDQHSLVALQSGGYTHPWKSGYVLSQLIIGILLIVAWVIWEGKFAPHPMIPRELYQGQRVVALAFLVACIAGFDFYSLINFFPLAFSTLWSTDPVQVGLKGLGYGVSTTVGAVFWNAMLSTKLEAKYILLIASVIMSKSAPDELLQNYNI